MKPRLFSSLFLCLLISCLLRALGGSSDALAQTVGRPTGVIGASPSRHARHIPSRATAAGQGLPAPISCTIPSGSTACTIIIRWSTQNAGAALVTVQDLVGGRETVFASGVSGSRSAQIQAPPHGYAFRLYDISSGNRVLLAAAEVVATGTGEIAGSPNPCTIPNGSSVCISTITWSTQNVTAAQVTVEDTAGGGETVFAGGLSGSQNAQIQAPPHQYTFRLYDISSGNRVLITATTVLATGTGGITASPNPCTIPSNSTFCNATISWSTQNVTTAQVTVEDAAGGGETVFASGPSGSQSAQIQAPPHRYTFRLYDISSGSRVWLASTVVLATGTGTITGSPNPCMISGSATSCNSTISWTTQNVSTAQVTVEDAVGGGETLFASTVSGSQSAQIQPYPHQYTFRLYDTSSGSRVWLAATTVVAAGSGAITASPNPCVISGSATFCSSTVSWSTQNMAAAEVTVQDASGGGEQFFASGLSGSQAAQIQAPPHQYTFRLYDTSGGNRVLVDATTVLATGTGAITASPNPCTISGSATSCASTLSWSTQNVGAAEITVQDAGAAETGFATGRSGNKDAQIQLPPHQYTFRLYDISSGSRVLLASTVVFAAGTGTLTASPNPCTISGSATSCTSTISWSTQNVSSAQVTVQDAGGAEAVFASGLSGSQNAQIQLPPHQYTFRLYDISSGNRAWLAATVVFAAGTGTVTASPNPCTISGSATSCNSTISWSTQNVASAQVTVQNVGGAETVFGSGTSGSQTAQIQAPPNQYTFRLYDISSGNRAWLASTVVSAVVSSAPAAPSNLTASIKKTFVHLQWKDNSTNEDSFIIERCQGSTCTNFSQIASTGANSTTYQDTKVARKTTYRYRVKARNAGGDSPYSNIVGITTP